MTFYRLTKTTMGGIYGVVDSAFWMTIKVINALVHYVTRIDLSSVQYNNPHRFTSPHIRCEIVS